MFKKLSSKLKIKTIAKFLFTKKPFYLQKAKQSQSSMEMAGVFYNIDQWYNAGLIEVIFGLAENLKS